MQSALGKQGREQQVGVGVPVGDRAKHGQRDLPGRGRGASGRRIRAGVGGDGGGWPCQCRTGPAAPVSPGIWAPAAGRTAPRLAAPRLPRAQPQPTGPFGGGHSPLAALLHVAEFHGVRSGACQHRRPGDPQFPRAQRRARRLRAVAHRPQFQPGVAQHGPGTGSGSAGPDLPADGERRVTPAHPRVVGGQLGCVADALGGLRYGTQAAGLDAVQGLGQQARAGGGEPGQQVTGGVLRADRLRHHPVHRPGVQFGHEPERGGPGHVVAVPDGVRDRRGAPPGGQQREMQVHPPVRRYLQRCPRNQRSVRGDRAAVRCERAEPVKEDRIPGEAGLSTSMPALAAHWATGLGPTCRPRPAAASGRVSTATTSCLDRSSSSRESTAVCGVPAKITRMA